jgi:hypothetical protein
MAVVSSRTLSHAQPRVRAALEQIVNEMGNLSAKAQGLGAVITTLNKLLVTDHRLYIHRSDRSINGILKVGKKNLFIRESLSGTMHEIEPLCVLDFYVHESVQVSCFSCSPIKHSMQLTCGPSNFVLLFEDQRGGLAASVGTYSSTCCASRTRIHPSWATTARRPSCSAS